ncbi:MAG TPA: hypothetical protein VIV40_00335 [Kofleriaceae bacterium]
MANQRGTFAKRQREMDLKDKARAKEARRAAKKDGSPGSKGPQIDWDQPGGLNSLEGTPGPATQHRPPPPAAAAPAPNAPAAAAPNAPAAPKPPAAAAPNAPATGTTTNKTAK